MTIAGRTIQKKRHKTSEPNLVLYPSGVYYYRKGTVEEALGRFETEADAIRAKKAFEWRLDELGVHAFKITVNDVLPGYIEERTAQAEGRLPKRRKLSQRSLKECRDLFRLHLGPYFGKMRLAEINEPVWNRYCKQATVNDLSNHRKVIRTFLGWCRQNGWIRYLPDLKIPMIERRERRVLKPDEIRALLHNSHGNLLLFVSLYLFMGMRAAESLKLPWSRVNLANGTIGLLKKQVKTRRARAITINPFVLSLLRRRFEEQREAGVNTPWVFPNRKDRRRHAELTGLKTAWKTCLRNAGISEITPHDLRATFEYFANKRADFTDAQREKYAGASITVQKNIYVDFDADDVRGLERVVEVDGLQQILENKTRVWGKRGEDI